MKNEVCARSLHHVGGHAVASISEEFRI